MAAAAMLIAAAPVALAFSPQSRWASNAAEALARGEPVPGGRGVPDPTSDCHSDHSSTVWMCISTVLVLGMSPALALFEAGMLRSKSTVSLITQIFAGVITLSVMWVVFGYTLTFGPTQGGVIGKLNHVMFIGLAYDDCSEFAKDIPESLFAMFQVGSHTHSAQSTSKRSRLAAASSLTSASCCLWRQMMFAVITPLLMTGSFAERLKFKSYMMFIILWQILVYYPLAHWSVRHSRTAQLIAALPGESAV